MQISQNNQQSFGIKMVRFDGEAAKQIFKKHTKFQKNLPDMWQEISKIKPSKINDDACVSICKDLKHDLFLMGRLESELNHKGEALSKNMVGNVFQKIDDFSREGIVNAFKNLVNKIDKKL